MKKLVCGIGINDADYTVQKKRCWTIDGKRHFEVIWTCPFYEKWKSMMERCYSEKYQAWRHTYKECSTVPEWHYFMTFRSWMEKQDWEDKQLDKDILIPGNKVYGPDTCVFVNAKVNNFVRESAINQQDLPVGVSLKYPGKYQARCNSVETGKTINLGHFENPSEAHFAWLTEKIKQAKILADEQTDQRVSAALVDRYENYEKYFGDGLELN